MFNTHICKFFKYVKYVKDVKYENFVILRKNHSQNLNM